VTNGRLYGGVLPLVPAARVDDGVLDLVLFPGAGLAEVTAHAARVLTGLLHTDPRIIIRKVRRLRLETHGRALPVETDGDSLGTTPLELEIVPGALLALGVPD
jgi:diacylglycerol kinase (ATP)